jgi:hypothetical protein
LWLCALLADNVSGIAATGCRVSRLSKGWSAQKAIKSRDKNAFTWVPHAHGIRIDGKRAPFSCRLMATQESPSLCIC